MSAFQCSQPLSYGDIPIVLIAPKNNETLSGTNADVVLGSLAGDSIEQLPWHWIVDVELIPQAGPVYVTRPVKVHAAGAPISIPGINNLITRLVTIPFHNLPPGKTYRILVTKIDPADPPGCPVHIFKNVLGEFSTAGVQ